MRTLSNERSDKPISAESLCRLAKIFSQRKLFWTWVWDL